MPTLRLSGVPPREPDVKLSKHFSRSAWGSNWKKRRTSLLNNPPARNQQNYLLYIILENLCARKAEDANLLQQRPTLQSPIFPHPPTVGIASFRCLIKFLSGMGDFGRVNAHQPRWKCLPGLRESDNHKRACLFCWKQSRNIFEDSEWHCVFSCPIGNACRKRCQLAFSNIQSLPQHVDDGKESF